MKTENMDDADYQELKENGWRRPLTPVEEERLRGIIAARPSLGIEWDEEAALNRVLGRMPSARVSSNFTARVVQGARATGREPALSRRLAPFGWLSRNWMPRVALGFAMVCCTVVSFREYQAMRRAQMAHELAALPPVEWLKDFDTINRLNKVSGVDNDLLAALR